jgi:hypothetical protein
MLGDVKALVACVCCVLATTVVVAAGAVAKPGDRALCPLKAGSPSGGDVQWAFTETGHPSGKHAGIRSSYIHGRGNWTAGRAIGKACSQDSLSKGPARNLVLTVAGKAKLSPKVTELGLLGVRLVLPVRVSASDDTACPARTRGTLTLFASYYAIHRDSLKLHFAAGCAGHNLTYRGSRLHVLIARHGVQVSTTWRGHRQNARPI